MSYLNRIIIGTMDEENMLHKLGGGPVQFIKELCKQTRLSSSLNPSASPSLPGVGPHPIVAAHVLVRSDLCGLRAESQGQDGQGRDDPSHAETAEILLLPNLGLTCIMYLALSRGRTLSQHDGCVRKDASLLGAG